MATSSLQMLPFVLRKFVEVLDLEINVEILVFLWTNEVRIVRILGS